MTPQEIKDRVETGNFFAVDHESFYSKEIGLKTLGVEKYLEAVNKDVYLTSVYGPNDFFWVGDPRDFDWQKLNGQVVSSHNRRFDSAVEVHLKKLGIIPEDVVLAAEICTADLSVYFSGQRALKKAARYFYDEDMDKGYRDVAKGMKRKDFIQLPGMKTLSISDSFDTWHEQLAYASEKLDSAVFRLKSMKQEKNQQQSIVADCVGKHAWLTVVLAGYEDAKMCYRLCQDYFCDWPDMEVTMSAMTREGGMKGVYIDKPLLDKQITLCKKVRDESLQKLPWYDAWQTSGLKTPTARRFVDTQCEVDGIPIPASMNKADEKYIAWLDTYGSQFEWIDAIRKWNNAHKCLTTFETCRRRIRENGTMPFGGLYFGAHTGRWSGAQRYNMWNHMKKYREKDHPLASIDARGIHIPRPGYKFVISDQNQIEWRVKTWLVRDWESMELCKTVHPYLAGAVARGSWDLKDGDVKWLKEHKPTLYSAYKMQELALQYSTGFKKFIVMLTLFGCDPYEILGNDPSIDEVLGFERYMDYMDKQMKNKVFTTDLREMKKDNPKKYRLHVCSWVMVNDWRKQNWRTTDLWRTLGDGFRAAVRSPHPRYMLNIPPTKEGKITYMKSDRKTPGGPEFVIRMPSGRDLTYHKIEQKKEGLRCKIDLYKKGKNAYDWMFDGKFLEHVCQAIARDVFAWQVEQLYYAGIPALWTVHDEVIVEVSESEAESVMAQVHEGFCRVPPWMPGLVLDADTKIVDKYMK